jgi:hypothetical protein
MFCICWYTCKNACTQDTCACNFLSCVREYVYVSGGSTFACIISACACLCVYVDRHVLHTSMSTVAAFVCNVCNANGRSCALI